MASTLTPALKLSICITTFNRAAFIGATLDSMLPQLTTDSEILVLDGASTDDTEQVVSRYTRHCDRLRYIRQGTNHGIDRDYDHAVELARGEFCWLMTDDDLLKPGAVKTVLQAIRGDVSLVIVNIEARNFDMSKILQRRWLGFDSDRVYGPEEMDRLFVELNNFTAYIGCVVIRRSIWLAREKQRYFGSLFVQIGVIFQKPLPGKALVIAEPFISHRIGNSTTYKPRVFEISMITLPSLLRSLPISDSAKNKVFSAEPWRSFQQLLLLRAFGSYSLREYRQWIHPRLCSIREMLTPTLVALFPGTLANALLISYFAMTRRYHTSGWSPETMLLHLRRSPFHFRNWRAFKR